MDFSENTYTIYKSADYVVEGITLEFFMNKVMDAGMDAGMDALLQLPKQSCIKLPVESLEYMLAISARDYYGIAEIVYFCCCGIICATGIFSNEKKYGIARRFQVSHLSETQNYFGKFIPIVLTVSVGMEIDAVITVLLYNIQWGKPLLSMSIVFLMVATATAMGLMLYRISDNLVITIILQFTITWFFGFAGSSFETYMFSRIPDTLKRLSPIYHGNRALVELSCMGKSSYVTSAVLYFLAITVVCSIAAILAGNIRKRGKA